MANTRNLIVRISGDTSGLDRNLERSSKKTAAVMGFIAGITQNVMNRAINTVSDSIGGAVKRVDTLSNAQKTFKNIGFSVDDTASAMTALDQSIRGLPTSLDQAVSGMVKISASNNDVVKAQKVYSALNNAILGFGGSSDMVDNAVTQLSQDLGAGRLTAQTWLSLTNSGLTPALAAMARQMGLTTKELKEGLGDGSISVDKFQDALIELNKKGGGGMKSLEKIAKDATSGIGTGMTNAKTAITRGVADIIDAVGQKNVSDSLKRFGDGFGGMLSTLAKVVPKIQEVAEKVGDYLGPKFEALWKTLTEKIFPALSDLWQKYLQPLVPIIGTALVIAVGAALDILNGLFTAIEPLLNFLHDNTWVVWGLVAGFAALKLAMMAQAGIVAFQAGMAMLTTTTIPAVMTKLGAMRVLMTAPMAMGAIGIAAPLAAIAAVGVALYAFKQDLNKIMDDTTRAAESKVEAFRKLSKLARTGTPEQRKRALEAIDRLNKQGYATGGFTGRGGKNEIAGVVHRGEYVLPKSMVDQTTGTPKAIPAQQGSSVEINFNPTLQVGMFAGMPTEYREVAERMWVEFTRIAKSNGISLQPIGVRTQ